jgi:hypothetical protein
MSASSSRSSTLEASEPFVRGDIALEFDLENLFRDPPQNALGAISGVSKGCEHEPCSGCRDAVVERDVNAQFALNLVIGKRPNANTGKVRTAEYRILLNRSRSARRFTMNSGVVLEWRKREVECLNHRASDVQRPMFVDIGELLQVPERAALTFACRERLLRTNEVHGIRTHITQELRDATSIESSGGLEDRKLILAAARGCVARRKDYELLYEMIER